MKPILLIFSGFLISFFAFTSTSCHKETDCKATIRCVDSTGNNIANASVMLFAKIPDPNDPLGVKTFTGDVKANDITNENGEVNFVFKLPANLDVQAISLAGARTISVSSIIKLEEGKTVQKTVTLK